MFLPVSIANRATSGEQNERVEHSHALGKIFSVGEKSFLEEVALFLKRKIHAWNGMNRTEKMTLRQWYREYFDGGHKS